MIMDCDRNATLANEEIKKMVLVLKVVDLSFESSFFLACIWYLLLCIWYFEKGLIAMHLWQVRRSRIYE